MLVNDLVRYNDMVRGAYLEAMAKLPWNEVVKHRGLSFDSMRDVFVHLTFVEDRWISYTIPGRFKDWVDPDFDTFTSIDSLKAYMQQVHINTERYLAHLSYDRLNNLVVIPWGEKPTHKLSVEACLTHVVMECMVHFGELSAAFWQTGVEAPYEAYWRYEIEKP